MAQPIITKEQADLLRRFKVDFEFFSRKLLKISNKSGEIVNFELNYVQLRILDEIMRLIKEGKPVRVLILKARQMGVSLFFCGLFYHMIWKQSNLNASIISHLSESSHRLLERVKFFHSNLPVMLQHPLMASNRNELYMNEFDKKSGEPIGRNSKIEIKTAESPNQLRSGTYQALHCSEVAFWKDAAECSAAAFNTVANHAGTIITIETTANGKGNFFHKLWTEDNDWVKMFFPWHIFPEYCAEPNIDFKPSRDEEELIEIYKLSYGQLQWRRNTIRLACNNDEELFMQEYPASPEEAFRATGMCRFSMKNLRWYQINFQLPKPAYTGVIDIYDEEMNVDEREINHKKDGGLSIWKPYEKRTNYALFADVAEGKVFENGKTGDRSGADVIRLDNDEKVAEWHGIIEPGDFGKIEVFLAKMYGNAVIVQEINNHGHAAMNTIRQVKRYPDSLIFGHKDNHMNEIQGIVGLGWLTTSKSRPNIINNLARMIQHKEMGIVSYDDICEMETFIKRHGKEPAADENCFDDRVMKTAIREWLITRDWFIDQYNRQYEYWECCARCEHFDRSRLLCIMTTRKTEIDDVCRIFEMAYS